MKKIFTLLAAATLAAAPALADTAYVGDYDNPSEGYSGSGMIIPFDASYEYSYSQTLYTTDMLTGQNQLNQLVDGKASKSEITSITFKMIPYGGGEFYSLSGKLSGTIYIQNIDDTSFPVNNSKFQWFDVVTTNSGTFETPEYSYDYVTADDLEFTITLDTPLVYEGKSLLITWITSSTLEDGGNSADIVSQIFDGPQGHTFSGVTSSSSELGIQNGPLTNSSRELPVLKLEYTPIIDENAGDPVSFDNVQLKLESVGTSNSSYPTANVVAVTFDVDDPSSVGEYEIFMGTQSLGTISGTSGTIRYLAQPKSDIILKIEAEGATSTTHTISADEVNAMFVTPTAAYTDQYALYASYDFSIHTASGTSDISGAALFQMNTPVPVARISAGTSANSPQLMRPSGSYPENIEALMPEGVTASNYNYVHAADGKFAIYSSKLATAKLVDDVMQWPEQVSISLSELSANYPVISLDTPALVAGKDALPDTETIAGTLTTIQKPVGSTIKATMAVEAPNFVFDAKYPDKLFIKEDKQSKTMQCTAPEGKYIWWIVETKSRAENEWTKEENNPCTISYGTLEPGVLTIVASETEPDLKNIADNEKAIYTVNEDGTTTSIKAVKAAAGADVIYDLQGRRVAAPAKGINIINGKKVIL